MIGLIDFSNVLDRPRIEDSGDDIMDDWRVFITMKVIP